VTHIPLEGNLNLRDLGGYPSARGGTVRTGCLFRSDELHALTDADLVVVAGLGVRVVFDLRNDTERALRPSRLPPGVELHERATPSAQPVQAALRTLEDDIASGWVSQADDDEFVRVYFNILTRLAPELRRIIELASDAVARPLLFHCKSGKDRTGVAAAVLLGLLGVPDETILDDYELTTKYATEQRLAEVASIVERHGVNPDDVRRFISPRRSALAAAITHIRNEHGGYDAYATNALGVAPDVPKTLRARLLT
jgi:protein-tyrosine phosphatase